MFKKKRREFSLAPDIDALALSMTDQSPFYVNEAVNHLCINIMSLRAVKGSRVFMMTSSGIREGKTVVSAGLARNLAKLNKNERILFVDADLRSTGITSYISQKYGNPDGLSEYLSNQKEELNFLKTDLDNFDILSSGAKMKNPVALLASPKMKSFIDACRENYDYVIIDSSPVGIVKDALLFASYVDGYMLSVRADKSKIQNINDAIDSIKSVKGEVIGVVLNSLDVMGKRTKRLREEAMEIARIYSSAE